MDSKNGANQIVPQIITLAFLFLCVSVSSAFGKGVRADWELGPFIKDDGVNPILEPRNDTMFFCPVRGEYLLWEIKDVFNPTAIVRNGLVHLLYRAEDEVGIYAGTSRVGVAVSSDALNFTRESLPIFYPKNDDVVQFEWEGGIEDPRVCIDENGTYFMTYTAYDGKVARLMVASTRDLKNWTKHGPVFRNAYDGKFVDLWSKSGSIVTRLVNEEFVATRINGSYYMYWGDTNMFLATSTDLINWVPKLISGANETADVENLLKVFGPRPGKFDSDLVEPGPAAFITNRGIVLIYNSRNRAENNGGDPNLPEGTYSAAQILLDPQNPSKVLERAQDYFMTPDKDYEITGQVNNVVFLEGLVYYKGQFHIYYGTADSKIAVASTPPEIYNNFF